MPSPSSFLLLDIPPFDDEDENDKGERPYEKDGNTGGEDDNGEEYIIYHIYDDAMINVPSANEEDGVRS